MINLTNHWRRITNVAKQRLRNNVTEKQRQDYGDELEILGAAGEMSARIYLHLPKRLHTGFDGGSDLVYRGITIDVKTTRLTPKVNFRNLQMALYKLEKPEVFLKSELYLMTAVDTKRKRARILGFATRDEILNARINRERDVPCVEIPVKELHEPRELLKWDTQNRNE